MAATQKNNPDTAAQSVEDFARATAHGERAQGLLKQLKIPAIPRNYELLYAFVTATNKELCNALRKALILFYPGIEAISLTDFKVRVLNPKEATAAAVRVFIESRDADESWTTIGVSEDVIEASWRALLDSIAYKLLKK